MTDQFVAEGYRAKITKGVQMESDRAGCITAKPDRRTKASSHGGGGAVLPNLGSGGENTKKLRGAKPEDDDMSKPRQGQGRDPETFLPSHPQVIAGDLFVLIPTLTCLRHFGQKQHQPPVLLILFAFGFSPETDEEKKEMLGKWEEPE